MTVTRFTLMTLLNLSNSCLLVKPSLWPVRDGRKCAELYHCMGLIWCELERSSLVSYFVVVREAPPWTMLRHNTIGGDNRNLFAFSCFFSAVASEMQGGEVYERLSFACHVALSWTGRPPPSILAFPSQCGEYNKCCESFDKRNTW